MSPTDRRRYQLMDRGLKNRRWICTFVVIAGAVVVDDQFTKALAAQSGAVAGNPALAFGVVEGSARLLSLGMIVVLIAFLRFIAPRAAALGIWPAVPALIAGGMFANLVDRLRFGVTRDFILTPWVTVNVADLAVIAGAVGLFVAAVSQMYKLRDTLRA